MTMGEFLLGAKKYRAGLTQANSPGLYTIKSCRSATRYCRHSAGFAPLAAILLGGFFIITVALDIAYETFFLTHLLKAFDHLLNRFTGTGLDLDHKNSNLLLNNTDIYD